MTNEEKIVWRRVDNSRQREPILVGRRISSDWLSGKIQLLEVRLGGKMRQMFDSLRVAAKEAKLNLPITSLRTSMIVALDSIASVVGVDRDLGLMPAATGESPAAVQLSSYASEDDMARTELIRATFCETIRRWVVDDVLQWAEAHGIGEVAAKLMKAVDYADVSLEAPERPYVGPSGRPNYSLIAQVLGRRLAGEILFEGLGPCEVVAFSDPNSNMVELMTCPTALGRDVFSMVARIRVSSVPYSKDVYLSVSAMKRVWARKVPKAYSNMPRSVLGYVVALGRPVTPIAIRRSEDRWVFGEEYAALYRASEERLPKTLELAIDQREFNPEIGWWVGLPELPSLFLSLSPRTVFEGDEIDLLNTVSSILNPIVIDQPIAVREIRRAQSLTRPLQEMLKIADFGFAGAGLLDFDSDEDDQEESVRAQESVSSRRDRIEAYRNQNILAVKQSRAESRPIVWMIGGQSIEADFARRSVNLLFGDAVDFMHEPMPANVHGLRVNLDGQERLPARARFEKRLAAWEPHTKVIREKSEGRPTIVLVCARDRYDNKAEDPVNYYAGIHAMSLIEANVHYVLPMESGDSLDEQQHFVHRLQSALLDVLLAHSGIVFGVQEFIKNVLPAATPKAIYGIQAVRSRARAMSGENSVSFVLFSRLIVSTGITEIKIVYRAGTNKVTDWMPLSRGLNWIGRMRTLQESDERWLKSNFGNVVRDELATLHEEDPNAVVLIDWKTVTGLWKGIRDEDLTSGKSPMLDALPLSKLKGMTFIRLRRGDDTMSLRGTKTSVFRAWKQSEDGTREQLGEQTAESYYTTERNIVEIVSPINEEAQVCRHFVASMGYAKTVQIPRGLSCYRPMIRMKNIGAGFFSQDRKAAATIDAALPAPMDITVMTCPEGASPDVYAALVTGLRLGYAHYNDWTALPAPLFFRRKVDDYIIRYADESDGLEVPDRNEVVMPEGTLVSQDVVAEIIGESASSGTQSVQTDLEMSEAKEVSPQPPHPVEQQSDFNFEQLFASISTREDIANLQGELLVKIKLIRPAPLMDITRKDQRLFRSYHRLICGVTYPQETVKVRVTPPLWVVAATALSTKLPITKKAARRSWDFMVDYGYVRSGIRKPADDLFLSWLGEFVVVPQACLALVSITRNVGPLVFKPFVDMVVRDYAPSLEDVTAFDPYDIGSKEVGDIAQWACENKHDDLLSWLIFMVSQWPSPDWVEALIEHISSIPGTKTLDALMYYVASIKAIDEFLAHEGNLNKFPSINVRPNYLSSRLAPNDVAIARNCSQASESTAIKSVTLIENSNLDPFMAIKNILIKMIEDLSPGTESFDNAYDDLCKTLNGLAEKHEEIMQNQIAESEAAQRIEVLIARQVHLLESLIGERKELMIEDVHPKVLPAHIADQIEEELATIEAVLVELESHRAQMYHEASQPAATLAERRQVMAKKAAAEAKYMEHVEQIHEMLANSLCFELVIPDQGEELGDEVHQESNLSEVPLHSEVESPALTAEIVVDVPEEVFVNSQETQREIVAEPISQAPLDAVIATKLPSTITSSKLQQISAEPELAAEEVRAVASLDDFDRYAEVLNRLISQRLYGLASVHVAALGRMVEEAGDERLVAQHAILQALVSALDGMDCMFSFDMRLNEGLNLLLSAERLPSSSHCEPAPMALGILAAGIGNMLFDDSDVRWRIGNAVSTRLQEHQALASLVEHIDTIRQRGYVLTRDAFVASRIGDKQAIQRELERCQKRAAHWKHSHEIHSNFNHKGFKALHEDIFSPKNPIGACLAAMVKGDSAKVRTLFEEAHAKFKKASATVDEMWKKIGDRGKTEGLYRAQVVENIEITGKFIQGYLVQVDRSKSQKSDLPRDTNDFLTKLASLLNDAIIEVRSMELRTETERIFGAAAVKAMSCVLRLYEATDAEVCISNDKQKLLIQLPLGRDLMPAMGVKDGMTPSLCSPAEVLSETGRWADAILTSSSEGGDEDVDSALRDAFDRHLEAKRFLPAFLIERHVKSLLSPGNNLLKRYNTERNTLQAELQDARQRVTHAMTLSALPVEAETNQMQRNIEELLALVRQEKTIGHCDGDSITYPDFPQARAALRTFVLNPLEGRLEAAKEKLVSELNEVADNDGVFKPDIDRIRRMLDSNNAATLRTAHDALGILKQSGRLPAYSLSSSFDMAGEYEDFMKNVHGATANKPLLDGLHHILKAVPNETDPDWLKVMDSEQRASAMNLIGLWTKFFEQRALTDHDLIERLFREMGAPHAPIPFHEPGRPTRGKLSFVERAFAFPTTADEPLFIPPSLGSWGLHIEGYVLYGNVSDNDLRLVLQEAASTPTFIFARTKLGMEKRAALTNNLPAIVVDDELIAYMALHPNERFQSMMKVGMLTYSTNPYDDYDSQPVPPEMFFGRQEELGKLRNVKSLAVLYGGRRLGKSSLLAQIEHEESQKPEHHAVLISMQTVDVVGDHVLSAWEYICNQLARRKIVPQMTALARDWQEVRKHIETGLMSTKAVRSLYLLIDEADNLMGRELKVRHGDTAFMPTLVQFINDLAHVCQVRAVIAGLHNVTRMTNEENTVFGKADPIALKPFSTSDDIGRGIRLITKPLAAMGYLFKEEAQDLPLRILAVCNFYPAFVQLYCKRLVDQLQNNRQTMKPPVFITTADLDAVEADSTLLTNLRRKFEYNLDLDKRYKVIALALADVYYTEIDTGHYKGLLVSEIRDYCEIYGGPRFENVSSGVYEALLDEMTKLNVVERVGTRYVLRNPQIAMMIGDRERIKALLDDVSRDPPDLIRNHGERRIKMVHARLSREFPMPMAWIRRQMDPSDGELIILSGNAMSGLQDLIQMERQDWKLRDDYSVIPVPGMGPGAAIEELDRLRRKPLASVGRMLIIRPAGWRIDQIKEYVSVAKKRTARIVLLADPVRSFDLMQELESPTSPLAQGSESERGWKVIPVAPWSEDAVFFRASENGENLAVADSRDALFALLKATCGFGRELSKLCTSSLSLEQALAMPAVHQKIITPDLNAFYQNVGLPQSFLEARRQQMEDFLYFVSGLEKHSGGVEEAMLEYQISAQMFEYLVWMGLIQEGPKNCWEVPELYLDLMRRKVD